MSILVPFVCPGCRGTTPVNLVAVSRAGGATCAHCQRKVRAGEVSRGLVRPGTPTTPV